MNLKYTILFCVFAYFSLWGFSQTADDAFYIYRNDGQFNAFFCNEVDSLGYSNYDANGILHDEPVMQIIYTPDSIYRIPLEVIDSVGLEKPEIKYNPKVVKMKEKGLMDYLMSIDGMTLYFNSNMPKIIRPLKDDVLVYLDFDNDFFPDGFAGKVKDVRISSNAYVVECDSIYDITDIYEQLILIERLGSTSSEDNRKKVSGKLISSRTPISVEIGFDQDSCKINGAVNGTYIATIACNITKENQYINLRVNHDWNISANFIFQQKTSVKESKVFKEIIVRIPQIPIFLFKIKASKLAKIEGSVDLNASIQSPVHSYFTEVNFRNGKIIGNTSKISAEGQGVSNFDKSISFALDGSIQIAAKLFIGLETVNFLKSYLRTGFDLCVGPKLTGNVNFNVGTGNDNVNDYYTILKDSKVGLNLCSVDIDVVGEASFMGHHFNRKVFASAALNFPYLYHEWYIMPDFSELQIEKDQEKLSATINCTPTKGVLFPLSLGIGLYDNEGKLEELFFETSDYTRENEGYTIKQEFPMLEREKVYEAKPMIKFLGGEIPAFPTKKFLLEKEISIAQIEQTSVEYLDDGKLKFKANVILDSLNIALADEGVEYGFGIFCNNKMIDSYTVENLDEETGIEIICDRSELNLNRGNFEATTKGYWTLATSVRYDNDSTVYLTDFMQDLILVYDEKPSLTFTRASIISTEVTNSPNYVRPNGAAGSNYNNETIKYQTLYTFRCNAKGSFWLDNFKLCNARHPYWYNLWPTLELSEGDGEYVFYGKMHYGSNVSMDDVHYFQLILNNGNSVNNNCLVFGGAPQNPQVDITNEPFKAAQNDIRKKVLPSGGDATFYFVRMEKI